MTRENSFISIEKSARLTWLKNKGATHLLIALHGYGQLSTFFARKFEGLELSHYDILIPEALNRFYLEGSSGRVGASWMTKEEREKDIEDNQVYLHKLVSECDFNYQKIILLGFSQGGATAARFYFEKSTSLKGLILWGSLFPPDVEFPNAEGKTKNCHFVLGKQDPYFSSQKQKEVLTLHEELGMTVHLFEGKHDIDGQVLKTILLNF